MQASACQKRSQRTVIAGITRVLLNVTPASATAVTEIDECHNCDPNHTSLSINALIPEQKHHCGAKTNISIDARSFTRANYVPGLATSRWWRKDYRHNKPARYNFTGGAWAIRILKFTTPGSHKKSPQILGEIRTIFYKYKQ